MCMLGYHITIRTRHGHSLFHDFNLAQSTWIRLKIEFPDIWAACLMPNHIHLLVKNTAVKNNDPFTSVNRLNEALRILSMKHRLGKRIWDEIPAPHKILDQTHLKRQIRYVHLNPCRLNLVDDPLKWQFSTHRDLLGLRTQPWLHFPILNKMEWHSFISSDPTVHVTGSDHPLAGQTQTIPTLGVKPIIFALDSLFGDQIISTAQRRHGIVHLLIDQGYRENRILMEAAKVKSSRLQQIKLLPAPEWLPLARTYVHDERLRVGFNSTFEHGWAHQWQKVDKNTTTQFIYF
jgi:REP element-mobilizing transposase RayT